MSIFSELDVLKEIPGYQAIMRGVVKSLIQVLIEQLSAQTGEESVILTASINDGTLSHLGSETGKTFLEENDDIKSKFLGFCLQREHKRQSMESSLVMESEGPVVPVSLQKISSKRKAANQRRAGLTTTAPYSINRNRKLSVPSATPTYADQPQFGKTTLKHDVSNPYAVETEESNFNSNITETPHLNLNTSLASSYTNLNASESSYPHSADLDQNTADDVSTDITIVKQEPLDADLDDGSTQFDNSAELDQGETSFDHGQWLKNSTESLDYFASSTDMGVDDVPGSGKSQNIDPLTPHGMTVSDHSPLYPQGFKHTLPSRAKRSELTVNQKLEVLKFAEDHPKMSQRQLSSKFHLGKTTIHEILRRKDYLLNIAECDREKTRMSYTGKFSEMNDMVLKWYYEARSQNQEISGPLILEKAGEIADILGLSDFKKSNGWLCRFLKRNDISFRY